MIAYSAVALFRVTIHEGRSEFDRRLEARRILPALRPVDECGAAVYAFALKDARQVRSVLEGAEEQGSALSTWLGAGRGPGLGDENGHVRKGSTRGAP